MIICTDGIVAFTNEAISVPESGGGDVSVCVTVDQIGNFQNLLTVLLVATQGTASEYI